MSSVIERFCHVLTEQHSHLKIEELLHTYKMIEQESEVKITKEVVSDPTTTKKTLESFCVRLGLKKTCQKREELVTRIIEYLDMEEKGTLPSKEVKKETKPKETKPKETKPKETKPKEVKKETKPKEETRENVINRAHTVIANMNQVHVITNQYGNYEHVETHFVFNKISKAVVGVQDGEFVKELTLEDIEKCKHMNFLYVTPKNLNVSKGFEDVKIDEIEDPYPLEEEDGVSGDDDDDVEEEEH